TACHVNGADTIVKALQDELGIEDGGTTDDGLFSLKEVACLGCCSLAPVMMIQTGGGNETYSNLTKDKAVGILKELAAEAKEAKA
ncbi:MAG: NAD(P)H-dependent oxidoreductase subunit E, partial [Firmicutes bacterium]|nr:NAD(P)H-dependent oxidoreductase subunit E [Bacillota bacterium]